jgi:hypothetical protein
VKVFCVQAMHDSDAQTDICQFRFSRHRGPEVLEMSANGSQHAVGALLISRYY